MPAQLAWFIAGRTTAVLGDILYNVAVLVAAYQETESLTGTASILIVTTLARLLGGLVAGQLVDRAPYRRLLVSCLGLGAAASAVVGGLALQGPLPLAVIYTAGALLGFLGALMTPALSAAVPRLVSDQSLVRANGLVSTALEVTGALAWGAGGLLVKWLGAPSTIFLHTLFFLLAAVAHSRIALPRVEGPKETPWTRLAAGWRPVWRNPVVRAITIMDSAEMFANTVWSSALLLAYTTTALSVGEEWWGYQSSAYFVGTMLGGLLAVWLASWLSRRGGPVIALSSMLFAVLTLGYYFSEQPMGPVILCVVMGPVYQVRDVVQQSLLQASLERGVTGRVFAARGVLLNTLAAPSLAIMSALADWAGVRTAYLIAAVVYGAVALLALGARSVWTYRLQA